MAILHDKLFADRPAVHNIADPLPVHITDNLKPGFGRRPYQLEAFKRFIFFQLKYNAADKIAPTHLLYNMATGSGKTLVMAGLMLDLYARGYRNFLFFVNSNNIISKSKENFLNSQASKYLFSDNIVIGSKKVLIKEVANFDEADEDNINIKFTTIQQLHTDLTNTKENSLTYEDFKGKKIVLIADEAHHLSSATKSSRDVLGSWEGTVMQILRQRSENLLLEFTATLDYNNPEILKKYEDKIIYKYDLAQFRKDKYSKEINLVRSMYNEQDRILQALLLNLYRQELALVHHIHLKPVILFKAKKTIRESEQNKENFHDLVDSLDASRVDRIRNTSTVDVVRKAFAFFDSIQLSSVNIAGRLKQNFGFHNCISANNDMEAEKNQFLLNSLEDGNNPIRAVFAVQKLNEGWDVLNLFDIVRLYEGQNGGGSGISSTTLSEAQLIGRGARYFPFVTSQELDRFTRKFDDEPANDLKVLEELYYHTKEDSRYISELKSALIQSGIYEDDAKRTTIQLDLTPEFKETDFYKNGFLLSYQNDRSNLGEMKDLRDLKVKKSVFNVSLSSGSSKVSGVFTEQNFDDSHDHVSLPIAISDIAPHVIRYALSENPFFYFDNLQRYFSKLASITEFINSKDYLGAINLSLSAPRERLTEITQEDKLFAIQKLLQQIEIEIKHAATTSTQSNLMPQSINKVIGNRTVSVNLSQTTAETKKILSDAPWWVYENYYGSAAESSFIRLFADLYTQLEVHFQNIYLLPNYAIIKLTDETGHSFTPSFILFCKEKKQEGITHEVLIEPDAGVASTAENWKDVVLKSLSLCSKKVEHGAAVIVLSAITQSATKDKATFQKSLFAVLKLIL